jgi:hypothetical protein
MINGGKSAHVSLFCLLLSIAASLVVCPIFLFFLLIPMQCGFSFRPLTLFLLSLLSLLPHVLNSVTSSHLLRAMPKVVWFVEMHNIFRIAFVVLREALTITLS